MKKIVISLLCIITLFADEKNIFKPFYTLNELAKRQNLEKFTFSPLMSEQDLKNYYKQLALKYHPDKGGSTQDFQNLKSAYDEAQKLLNPPADIRFILNEGTYVLGEIPAETSVPPLHFGFLKQKNDDPQVGKLVCFGPQHQSSAGKRVKIRNGQASDDCFRAQADESEFGCRELSSAELYKKGLSCETACWKGGAAKKSLLGKKTESQPANCNLP
ncbi:MAG: hypothetical protein US13_C0007G0001 [candidate division TM6 bacterium GW2011_GWE2_36_25]|nr:MAG: hypothetical protein US03_C0007G0068 [candidate division TM6 bacterium GW2011_GWF2_36_131]KKQ02991.1 MAG: hypothetical protein US13_C0007G0001 [candidate division TM6 bacterium GW2011_GWE2_36_25]KKQ19548.1 MAG: hypothetical protein US32_C0007G0001 [candidate division TM6 bacterium GW2011_GWA2_36_9]